MDSDLRCNRLTCRQALSDKAVVTTCCHIFCVNCANELFNAARLCPACETSLVEPDDIVLCSLHPTNDYKTSVLSGLSPGIILEICSRAVSFWQYQMQQENSFQHAVVRNVNDKNSQLQKQLDSVIREANGEINLLNNKVSELERDLELERRKLRDLQESSREKDKEYQKLKGQYDKIKRKVLLAPSAGSNHQQGGFFGPGEEHGNKAVRAGLTYSNNVQASGLGIGAAVGGMEANGIQRTPIVNRAGGGQFAGQGPLWSNQNHALEQPVPIRQQFPASERSFRAPTLSDRSTSAQEVEDLLGTSARTPRKAHNHGHQTWAAPSSNRSQQRVFAPTTTTRRTGGFKPVVMRTR